MFSLCMGSSLADTNFFGGKQTFSSKSCLTFTALYPLSLPDFLREKSVLPLDVSSFCIPMPCGGGGGGYDFLHHPGMLVLE
jgi:hypothetical protein